MAASNSLRERADEIHKAGLGSVFTYADGKETPAKEITPDAFWKALTSGGAWTQKDNRRMLPLAAGKAAVAFSEPESAIDLPLIAIREPHNPGDRKSVV